MKKWAYPLAILTFLIFIGLRFTYQSEVINSLDVKMANWLFGNRFIEIFHYIGEPAFVVTIAVLLMVYLAWKVKNYRSMLLVIFTFAAGNGLNHILKKWVQRPRPDIEEQLLSFSFPSGHAMTSILYLFTLAYIWSENHRKHRYLIWLGAIILTLFIGLSRIAGARHFASDVLAGWCMGYTWFIICILWYERRQKLYQNE
ncbi:phosphatase PAP2 family protein [Lysinibacillus piscis]|uniref:Phosphatidylglycerophosphatase B n=1 Tax=Lysinibacillus piscis TaxID=2518931 RepID=A0ABQ5NMI0_9BACI|nr:phosphatase PAP2 family protein [Lysinibacillus sp. KH24]GLC89450.1 phosphatidylglycerophosphatase B [Lysinibacillus sp. KH24]